MTSVSVIPLTEQPTYLSRARGETAVLETLRRLNLCCPGAGGPGAALRAYLVAAPNLRGARAPILSPPGCLSITKDERRMLRALDAAQAGDAALFDNYIFRFAIDRGIRAYLAEALQEFAKEAVLSCKKELLPNSS